MQNDDYPDLPLPPAAERARRARLQREQRDKGDDTGQENNGPLTLVDLAMGTPRAKANAALSAAVQRIKSAGADPARLTMAIAQLLESRADVLEQSGQQLVTIPPETLKALVDEILGNVQSEAVNHAITDAKCIARMSSTLPQKQSRVTPPQKPFPLYT